VSKFRCLLLTVVFTGLFAGCGGGSDVTTVSPEDQKMLETSHSQAGDSMKDAADASKGKRPGGHN
jgi:hypothetical protein